MESYADVYTTDPRHIERNLYIKIILVHRLKINCMRLSSRYQCLTVHHKYNAHSCKVRLFKLKAMNKINKEEQFRLLCRARVTMQMYIQLTQDILNGIYI
jgi:hypothetical protein